MIIETKFNIGDMVMVKPGDRPVHLSELDDPDCIFEEVEVNA